MKIYKVVIPPSIHFEIISENKTEENLLTILVKETAKDKKIFFSKINKGEITIKLCDK